MDDHPVSSCNPVKYTKIMITGLGIDIVEIERIAAVIRRHGDAFLHRVFTDEERTYCGRFANPMPEYATRFAAKEALMKALGTGLTSGVSWQDIEVVKKLKGPPRIHIKGRAAEIAGDRGIMHIHLSQTHTAQYAAAVVVVENG